MDFCPHVFAYFSSSSHNSYILYSFFNLRLGTVRSCREIFSIAEAIEAVSSIIDCMRVESVASETPEIEGGKNDTCESISCISEAEEAVVDPS